MAAETDDRTKSVPISVDNQMDNSDIDAQTAAAAAAAAANRQSEIVYGNSVSVQSTSGAGVPSFLMNPFMTPFMPQHASQIGTHEHNGKCRSNPFQNDAYFVQSLQCHEMMQHYIHSLMAAAAKLPTGNAEQQNKNVSYVTEKGEYDQWDDSNFPENTDVLSVVAKNMEEHLNIEQTQAESSRAESIDSTKTANVEQNASKAENSTEMSIANDENDVSKTNEAIDDLQKNESNAIPQAVIEDSERTEYHCDYNSVSENKNASPVEMANQEINESASEENGHAAAFEAVDNQKDFYFVSAENTDGEVPTKIEHQGHHDQPSNNNNNDLECRTSVLIKKQMNEIDREIHRRTQNKNIKKSALPFSIVEKCEKLEQSTTPSVEHLKNAYGLTAAATATSSSFSTPNSFVPPQTQRVSNPPSPNLAQFQPSPIYSLANTSPQAVEHFGLPPFTQFPPYFASPQAFYFPGAHQHVSPQLAAALLQQFQQGHQMGLFPNAQFPFPATAQLSPSNGAQDKDCTPGTSSATLFSTTEQQNRSTDHKIPPPPAASSNVRRKSLTKSSSLAQGNVSLVPQQSNCSENWLESNSAGFVPDQSIKNLRTENFENDRGEPVWVMRDSYLKRIEREEMRNNETNVEPEKSPEKVEALTDLANETESLLNKNERISEEAKSKKHLKKEVMVHEPAVLIEGVLFRARYLGSTQLLCEGRPTKASRMMQAQEAVARVKAPAGEIQPSTDIDLFISTEKIMVLNTDLQDIVMDHALRTISYIADIGDLVVLMARRVSQTTCESDCIADRSPKVVCHVFESDEASFIAQSIGQAFQVAYVEFLRANGIDDPSYLREIDYQEVLNSQELMGEELEMFARKETQKDVVVPKKAGEPLGVVVVESGWGSMLPTVVIANLQPNGAASRCNLVNIGDQIIAINGISLVGLPLASAQQNIKAAKSSTAVRLTIVSTPPVVEVRIKRPDAKYQLGFSVQNGVICSLLRGGIAERGGIRVGHRIIEINSQSVVAVPHDKIVNILATAIGEIHMKTMPTSMFRLLTGQEVPNYI